MQMRVTRRWAVAIGMALFTLVPPPLAEVPSLASPSRLTLTPLGSVVVSDARRKSVMFLDGVSLEVLDEIKIQGRPLAVGWGDNRLFVGNESTAVVEIYEQKRNGKWHLVRNLTGRSGQINQPTDIAVDKADGLVFVVSGGANSVMVFSTSGVFLRTLAIPGNALENLLDPTGIAVDGNAREVLVSDFGDPLAGIAARVQIYDYDGNHLGQISGESGQTGFEFSRPQGLVVSARGEILLVDSLMGQVLVFDREELRGVRTLGTYGSDPGQLLLPLDVAMDPDSMDVFVSNNRLGRVEVFEGGGFAP